MQIVSTRDFRANQKKYFDMAETEAVVVMRRGARPISLSVVKDEDFLSPAELHSIRSGLEDIKAGRVHKMRDKEDLSAFLDRIGNV